MTNNLGSCHGEAPWCHLWVEDDDRKVEGRSERAALCVHRSQESV